MLTYQSTRGSEKGISASQAIVRGIASDNGLYVPSMFPQLPKAPEDYLKYSYSQLAKEILELYLTDFTAEEIADCVEKAYGRQFDTEEIAPVVKVGDCYFLELFHGPTYAFKDMALQILPELMKTAAKKQGMDKKILILTATSGDTGKAAMEGFANVEDTKIMVFYPKDGVSFIQERQMTSQLGNNVEAVGIRGNFDDAQTGVKILFQDREFTEELAQKGYVASSANSINIGRLLPQVVYYVFAYVRLLKQGELKAGERLDVVVPTGNFGNILAAYYAKKMGLPLGLLVAASNENKVIADFFATGVYDKNREMYLTQSPSMDILVSSNLERLLFDTADSEAVKDYMQRLNEDGKYRMDVERMANIKEFTGFSANEDECSRMIRYFYDREEYLMDTHTAVAAAVAEKAADRLGKTLIVSTASPYKFSAAVLSALGEAVETESFALPEQLYQKTKVMIPKGIADLKTMPQRFHKVISKEEMKRTVLEFVDKDTCR